MNRIAFFLVVVSITILASSTHALARGGRGGGGASRGGGGGYSRPAPAASRSPSVSRPSTPSARPSTPSVRPSTPSARPSQPSASRPGTPAAGTRPSQGELQGFLDLKQPGGSAQPGTRPTPGGGGAAADFLENKPSTGQRPATPGAGIADRPAAGERPVAGNRPAAGQLAGNRPDRVENRTQLVDNRHERRDEVRGQFHDHHPRYDFWKDNPNWARWRLNRPYRWATWGAITGWFAWTSSEPTYYSYGDNVYYEGDSVYYGDKEVASSQEYAEQAQTIATSAPEPTDDAEWLPLGVFAITQDGQASGPAPTIFLQLAVSKEGVIAGTVTNTETDDAQAIEGMVDKKTQRSAWVVQGKESPIMETGIVNLTKDEAPALLHFADGQTQQWLLVRMEEPESEAATQ